MNILPIEIGYGVNARATRISFELFQEKIPLHSIWRRKKDCSSVLVKVYIAYKNHFGTDHSVLWAADSIMRNLYKADYIV